MTTQEFSDAFDVLLNSYSTQSRFGELSSKEEVSLDEYEKSVYLTKAQEDIVTNFYNGKNPYGESFESTEEMRRYLESLVRTKVFSTEEQVDGVRVSSNSVFYRLPDDVAFITMEQVTYDDSSLGCYDGSTASVSPITQDGYSKIKNNPFRGPTKYKVVRLDSGKNVVELISKYRIGKYLLRYLSKPTPIILEDLPPSLTIEGINTRTECALPPILHNIILERAVNAALQTRGNRHS